MCKPTIKIFPTRRNFVAAASAIGIAVKFPNTAPAAQKPEQIPIFATEEGWSCKEILRALAQQVNTRPKQDRGLAHMLRGGAYPDWPQLLEPEPRLADMAFAGVDKQLLMLSSPGVQVIPPEQAIDLPQLVNDRLAEWSGKWPDKFDALAAIPVQAPDNAVRELECAVKDLNLKGAVINSHTKSQYLDDRKFWPILEAAEALDVPIYLHPRSENLMSLAKDANLLISEIVSIKDIDRQLKQSLRQAPAGLVEARVRNMDENHLTPEHVGRTAKEANVGKVVLTHDVPSSGSQEFLDQLISEVRAEFSGDVQAARDLDRF